MSFVVALYGHVKRNFPGNDVEKSGAWSHAFDNSDVTWFSPKWTCWDEADFDGSYGGDAFELGITSNLRTNGAWCDAPSSSKHYFICESVI